MSYKTDCKMFDRVYMGNPGAVPWCKIRGVEPDCDSCARPSKTNADRIRAMSDEELAGWIYGVEMTARLFGPRSKNMWFDWMKEEAKDD